MALSVVFCGPGMHILFIVRHYPPEVSGGARRPYLYVQELRRIGHKVTLVTPFALEDEDSVHVPWRAIENNSAAEKQVPSSKQPRSWLAGLKAIARDWVYWPDHSMPWVRKVYRAVLENRIKPDLILTTSPPESIHMAGQKLSRKLGVPWVAELRDTWVETPHRLVLERFAIRRWLERMLAHHYLRDAAGVTAVSEAVMQEARKYVRPGTPEIIISHFSEDTRDQQFQFADDKVNLVHTGGFSLSDRHRTLAPLLAALDEVYEVRNDVILHIAGRLRPEEIALTERADIPVVLHGAVSLEIAKSMQAGADGLVLYTPANSHALPGKYAEYVVAARPILYMGGGDWLRLVDPSVRLRPLIEGASALRKGEIETDTVPLLSYTAAENLSAFLEAVLSRA